MVWWSKHAVIKQWYNVQKYYGNDKQVGCGMYKILVVSLQATQYKMTCTRCTLTDHVTGKKNMLVEC